MKKKIMLIALLVCICLPVFSQDADKDWLDITIERIYSMRMDDRLKRKEHGTPITLRVKTNYPLLTDYVSEKLSTIIVEDGRFRLIDNGGSEIDEAQFNAMNKWGMPGFVVTQNEELAKDIEVEAVVDVMADYDKRRNRWNFVTMITSHLSQTYMTYESYTDWFFAEGIILSLAPETTQSAARAAVDRIDPFFNIGAAFSYYPNMLDSVMEGSIGPLEYDRMYNYNLSLSMGLKLFRQIDAIFDFNTQDAGAMDKAMNIAGKIGSKWFGVHIDYQSTGGNVGLDQFVLDWNTFEPVTIKQDSWNQDIFTIGLMSPEWNLHGLGLRAGFIWNSITTPISYGIYYPDKQNIAMMEMNSFNTYGLRITADAGDLYGDVPFLSNDWGFIVDFVFDLSFGKATPGEEINAAVNALSLETDEFLVSIIRGRMLAGLEYKVPIAAKRGITFGFGLDFNFLILGDQTARIINDDIKYDIHDNMPIGFFARIKLII